MVRTNIILAALAIFSVAITGCTQTTTNIMSNDTSVLYDSLDAIPVAFDYYNYRVPNGTVNHTMLVPFPVVKSPMPYYVYNESEINLYKYNLTLSNLRAAFDAWENATKGKVKFYRIFYKPEDGITVKLIPNLPKDTIGEASPGYYEENNYTLIVAGRMDVEPVYGGAENLNLLIHEIGHIMGFGHSKNPHSVMYPWNSYSQVITDDITTALEILYRNVPAP